MRFYKNHTEPFMSWLNAPVLAKVSHQGASTTSFPWESRFTDNIYLLRVVAHLKCVRESKGLGIHRVARRAGIKTSAIIQAEQSGIIPRVHQFKAWSAALGLSWERVWTDSLPGRPLPVEN